MGESSLMGGLLIVILVAFGGNTIAQGIDPLGLVFDSNILFMAVIGIALTVVVKIIISEFDL